MSGNLTTSTAASTRPKRNCKRKAYHLIEEFEFGKGCSNNIDDGQATSCMTGPDKKQKVEKKSLESITHNPTFTSVNEKKRGRTKSLNFYRLSHILYSELKTVELCQELGVLPKSAACPTCNDKLVKVFVIQRRKVKRLNFRFQCNKKICKGKRNQVSLRNASFFKGTNISLKKSLILVYCFVNKFDYSSAIHESSISSGDESDSADRNLTEKNVLQTSTETVTGYYMYCREVCLLVIEREAVDNIIGGFGKTVEIDTAVFGKRRYSSGLIGKGHLVVAGLCRETKEVFLAVVPSNDDETLIQAVEQYVLHGTTIVVTEELPLYEALKRRNKGYVELDNEAGKNHCNIWSIVKRQQPSGLSRTYRKEYYYLHLAEYLYRYTRDSEGLFEQFLRDCAEIFNASLLDSNESCHDEIEKDLSDMAWVTPSTVLENRDEIIHEAGVTDIPDAIQEVCIKEEKIDD